MTNWFMIISIGCKQLTALCTCILPQTLSGVTVMVNKWNVPRVITQRSWWKYTCMIDNLGV